MARAETVAAIYLHVPKCGGTTLASAIEGMYPHGATFKISQVVREKLGKEWVDIPARERELYALKVLQSMPVAERERLRLITGHMVFGLHSSLPQGGRYFTMLRDPVKQVTSLYRYILDLPAHPHKERIQRDGLSVGAFAQSCITFSADNTAVRRISGIGESIPYGQCNAEHLAQAKANLDEYFDVAGIVEKFDDSLMLMKSRLGWTRQPYYVCRNISTTKLSKGQIGEQDLERVREQNWVDIEFYRYVKDRLQAQIEAEGVGFAERVAQFKAENARHGRFRVSAVKQAIKGMIRRA